MCVDQDRLLYHFLVEGTVVKDGSKVQCDVSFVVLALKPCVGVSVPVAPCQVTILKLYKLIMG